MAGVDFGLNTALFGDERYAEARLVLRPFVQSIVLPLKLIAHHNE